MRTTIIHHGALGDWMLVMPMIRALAQEKMTGHSNTAHAGVQITLGQSSGKSALACRLIPQLRPLVIDTPAWAELFGSDADPPAHVTAALRDSDRIISFVSTPHDAWSNNIARLAPQAKLHCISARPSKPARQHITAYHARQLAAQGLRYTPAHSFDPSAKRTDSPQDNLPSTAAVATANRPILIHPGSGGRDKTWPSILWESFIAHAQKDGWHLQPVLGEVELETWPTETIARWTRRFAAIGCTSLDELHDLLKNSRGLIGLDSGPAHLAAAMNLPTIALFGPTCHATWSPFGKHVHIIAPAAPCPMSWLHPEKVKTAMELVF